MSKYHNKYNIRMYYVIANVKIFEENTFKCSHKLVIFFVLL